MFTSRIIWRMLMLGQVVLVLMGGGCSSPEAGSPGGNADGGTEVDASGGNGPVAARCQADERVEAHTCVACAPGTSNAAGDDTAGPDTVCDGELCPSHHRVAAHACAPCPPGTTNAAGDDASGADTSCEPTLCMVDQHVAAHTCVACPPGGSNVAGDDAAGPDTACDGELCPSHQHVTANACVPCPPGRRTRRVTTPRAPTLPATRRCVRERTRVRTRLPHLSAGTTNAAGDATGQYLATRRCVSERARGCARVRAVPARQQQRDRRRCIGAGHDLRRLCPQSLRRFAPCAVPVSDNPAGDDQSQDVVSTSASVRPTADATHHECVRTTSAPRDLRRHRRVRDQQRRINATFYVPQQRGAAPPPDIDGCATNGGCNATFYVPTTSVPRQPASTSTSARPQRRMRPFLHVPQQRSATPPASTSTSARPTTVAAIRRTRRATTTSAPRPASTSTSARPTTADATTATRAATSARATVSTSTSARPTTVAVTPPSTCHNNVGAAPTCLDIDECATNNGGCHANAQCTIRWAASPACDAGYSGDGFNCQAIRRRRPINLPPLATRA